MLVFLLVHCAAAEQLRLVYTRYEGLEFFCHVEKNRCWYEFNGKKLAERSLKPAEIQSLRDCLQNERFWSLPPRMGNPRMDSYNCLKVWKKGKPYQVLATDSAGLEAKTDYQRFGRIIECVRKTAPLPKVEAP